MKCRHCQARLDLVLVDLGSSPPSNSYLSEKSLNIPELWIPLRVMVCRDCWLVQTEDFAQSHTLFDAEYAYFSSYSSSWLQHSREYVDAMIARFGLNSQSHIVEVAANDGYLLQYVKEQNIPCTGIEPTTSTATVAIAKGLDIIEEFFDEALAVKLVAMGKQADLTTANNVLAHVPDINGFVAGFAKLLKPDGVATFEFPHLTKLIEKNLFDTIYHEHYSYLSLTVVNRIFAQNGLHIFDVEEFPTQGGSLRLYAQRIDSGQHQQNASVQQILTAEKQAGVATAAFYQGLQAEVNKIKHDFLTFLLDIKAQGKMVAAYGAAAKGNTLLNYAGVRPDLLPYVVDLNPAKQGKFLPGSRIPIVTEASLKTAKPDYILILPWNIKDEVIAQLAYVREWGGKFVVAIPNLQILP